MEHLLPLLAQHGHLSANHYWHLRLLCALLLGPMAGVLYLLLFDQRAPDLPRAAAGRQPGLWVNRDGRLARR